MNRAERRAMARMTKRLAKRRLKDMELAWDKHNARKGWVDKNQMELPVDE